MFAIENGELSHVAEVMSTWNFQRTDDRGSLSSAKFAFSSNVNGGLPNLYGNMDDMGDGNEIKESDYVSANKLLGIVVNYLVYKILKVVAQ